MVVSYVVARTFKTCHPQGWIVTPGRDCHRLSVVNNMLADESQEMLVRSQLTNGLFSTSTCVPM